MLLSSPTAWLRAHLPRLAAAALLAPSLAALAAPTPGAVVQTPELRAELVAHAPEGLGPGKPMWLGLALKHSPRWHTYWKNPGDSGLPTRLNWTLPAGVTAGDIAWPAPKRQTLGPLVNYGYEGEQLLPVALTLPAGWSADSLPVRLRADWLVCAEVCLPQSGDFALDIPAQASSVAQAAAFTRALAAVPRVVPGLTAQAQVEGAAVVVAVSGVPEALRGQPLQLFAEQPGVIDHAAAAKLQWQGDRLTLRQALSPQRSESPATLQLVLAAPGEAGALQVAAPVTGGWPALPAPPQAGPAPTGPAAAAGPAPAADTRGSAAAVEPEGAAAPLLPLTLALAFAGGLLLNLMPCVFPVLSLKVLGLASHGGHRRGLVAGGLAYTAGVVLSFLVLALLLLGMRAGGAELGWGFQLQSPGFVAALALLFTLIGLNLLGVIGLAGVMPQRVCSMHAKQPLLEHALTGVLAALIASPCTAPFMGAALGVALTLPTAGALSVFLALGLGMAAPYLVVSCWPRLARALPRPGAWMEQLKIALAFPMFGTVVWLLWVFGQQVGLDGAAALLGLLVGVAFVTWAWAAAGLGRRTRRVLGTFALLLLGAGLLAAWPSLRATPAPAPAAGASASTAPQAGDWQPWSPAALAQARAEGRPVLVDFTAAWCVTCQFNKHGALANAGLLADLRSRQVLLLRADWTRRDAAITQALAAMGRNGVPVYALYPPGDANAAPTLLPELLSVASVRSAMARWPATQVSAAAPAAAR